MIWDALHTYIDCNQFMFITLFIHNVLNQLLFSLSICMFVYLFGCPIITHDPSTDLPLALNGELGKFYNELVDFNKKKSWQNWVSKLVISIWLSSGVFNIFWLCSGVFNIFWLCSGVFNIFWLYSGVFNIFWFMVEYLIKDSCYKVEYSIQSGLQWSIQQILVLWWSI